VCETRKLLLKDNSCVDADGNYNSRNMDNISTNKRASTFLILSLYANKTE
jgi:hypothetical protein